MGDIHGAYRALKECLGEAGFDYEGDRLIQLGDITDGYEEVYECVEELLKIRQLIAIRGNHDQWFLEFIRTGSHPRNWSNGAEGTARSYWKHAGGRSPAKTKRKSFVGLLKPELIPESHRKFFLSQRLYYIDRARNCFVHAGFDRHRSFRGQEPETYYWDRELWEEALLFELFRLRADTVLTFPMRTSFREVFIGHTPTQNWDTDRPMKAANIYDLDTGCGHGGPLTMMELSSKEVFQSRPSSRLYKKNYR